MTRFWCEHAWLPAGPVAGVRVHVRDGLITEVVPAPRPDAGDTALAGLVLPGLADAHSHAFHRALRGRTHGGRGDFWTWRRAMYTVAERLDPDRYLALARAAYAELVLGGVTCVGEFHYLHHPPGGGRYDDPNAMSEALVQAAADAGLRLTLLDTCYLAGDLDEHGHAPPDAVQRRFSDGDVDAWSSRLAAMRPRPDLVLGAAIHSVRAVPAAQLPAVAAVAAGRPLHVHLSEQRRENEASLSFYGRTPTALLSEAGVLGPDTTAVHAVHVDAGDLRALAGSGTGVCACPVTEADLADGIAPFRELADAGSPLSIGTDQHVVGDLFAEVQRLEGHERSRSGARGRFSPAELVGALTTGGHRALGRPDAGRIAAGTRADLVAVRLDSPRTAGARVDQAVLAAGAEDVTTVVVDGRVEVEDGRHRLGDVGALLRAAVEPLWEDL